MPESAPPDPSRSERSTAERSTAERSTAERSTAERSTAERAADHAAIHDLTEGLLPALMAKLSATGLGELEVREGTWHVRLRRSADGVARDKRASERAARAQGGHHAPAPAGAPGLTAVGPGRDGREGRDGATAPGERRVVATSPAVGTYRVAADRSAGTRIRAGDRVGIVDMLGVAQEVLSPMDGVIGASLAESGEVVEYGQELVVIEFASALVAEG